MGYYRVTQIKVPLEHDDVIIRQQISNQYGINGDYDYDIAKKSIDARKKFELWIVYNINVHIEKDDQNSRLSHVKYFDQKPVYQLPIGENTLDLRPVIVGAGPAGLFCALIMAECGLNPIVIERGQPVDQRLKDMNNFFEGGILDTASNVQFGEGGAGTFSDGKIYTGVKDKFQRIDKIVDAFIRYGAPKEIKYNAKPHIGTDYLVEVVKNMRNDIISLGGDVRFDTKMTSLEIEQDQVVGVKLDDDAVIKTNHVVLAIGHSARDTFEVLVNQQIPMEKKAFAVGLRIEHLQSFISKNQYGEGYEHPSLPAAEYKLTHRTKKGRGVYTFCMCPGGYVVNSASENGGVVCNGMSNFARDEVNANSAVLVNVHPEDFDDDDLLAGVKFQRKWEQKAFELGGSDYTLPVQLLGDYKKGQKSESFGQVVSNTKGKTTFANLNETLPYFVNEALKEGIDAFSRKIKGFNHPEAVLTGVETRSSSPVRFLRDAGYMSSIKGLYPCGEGAGYAGGIMSAALDGMKVAEAIITTKS